MTVPDAPEHASPSAPGPARPRPDGRQAILAAAREELAVSGPNGLSLRAVARRAGLSHAAPKHHFGDRAGILTALAAEGFRRLALALEAADSDAGGTWTQRVTAMGQAYVDFGLAEPDLFELMFQTDQLHPDDAELDDRQREAFASLSRRIEGVPGPDRVGPLPGPAFGLVAWAVAHGLVVLARSRAFRSRATGLPVKVVGATESADIARRLVDVFGAMLAPASDAYAGSQPAPATPPATTPAAPTTPPATPPATPRGGDEAVDAASGDRPG